MATQPKTRENIGRLVVVDELRKSITRGELSPGERIKEASVAEDLGVSRGPVREGLRDLEREGLILSYPNRGAVVMSMSDTELFELLLPIRLTVENFAAKVAATRLTTDITAALRVLLDDMRDAASAGDKDRVIEADVSFHRRIIEASEQPHAIHLWQSIQSRIQAQIHRIGRRRPSLKDVYLEHQTLLEALQSGDESRIYAVLQDHILHDAKTYMDDGAGG